MRQDVDDLVAVLAREPACEPGGDAVREQERLDLANGRHLTPGGDRALDALARDRATGLRAHLAQPLGVAVELAEDMGGAEVGDDRPREGRPDPGDACREPALHPFRGTRQRCPERLDRELRAVPLVLGEGAGADELVAGRDVPERPRERHRLPLDVLSERRGPHGELEVGRDVARPRSRERHLDLAHLCHSSDDTRGGQDPSHAA